MFDVMLINVSQSKWFQVDAMLQRPACDPARGQLEGFNRTETITPDSICWLRL